MKTASTQYRLAAATILIVTILLVGCGNRGDVEPNAVISPTQGASPSQNASPTQEVSSENVSSNQEISLTPAPTASSRSDASTSSTAGPLVQAPGAIAPALSVADIVDFVTPSVVHIQTDKIKIDEFNQPVPAVGAGTGVVFNQQGFLLTNEHVIRDATRVLVKLEDGRIFDAEVIGSDFPTDLAVMHIDADRLTPIALGSSSSLRIGDQVIAVGHALDLAGGPSVTGGLVSAFRRRISNDDETRTLRHLIQTDAAINPGNSGGPLLNMKGEMVGINTSTIPTADGISFSIAIDSIKVLIDELIGHQSIDRGFMGITSVNLTRILAMNMSLPVNSGAIIVTVLPGSAAEQAGLRIGDIIVAIEGEEVRNGFDLDIITARYKKGESIVIEYYRGSQRRSATVTLGERPR